MLNEPRLYPPPVGWVYLPGPLSSPVGSLNETPLWASAAPASIRPAAAVMAPDFQKFFILDLLVVSSAFDCAGRETGNQILLQEQEERHHRDGGDDRAGGEVPPLLREAADEEAEPHRPRVHVLAVHEGGGLDELVP